MPSDNKENSGLPCLVFPMGMEQYPFLNRVEVRKRWKRGNAILREVFFEGRLLLLVRCGIGPDRAAAAIRALDVRPSAILSVGTAGGLVPDLRMGDLVVSSETVYGHEPERIMKWPEHLVDAVSRACHREDCRHKIARVVTVRDAVFPRDDRQRLHQVTGAVAVDMESHALGLEASRLGVPFAALRVISDDLHSPPLPDSRSTRIQWKTPQKLPETIASKWRRRCFLKRFKSSIEALHPVLVRMIRESGFQGT
jgi:nucleoside phosphorylase